jgi:hypothetical protein
VRDQVSHPYSTSGKITVLYIYFNLYFYASMHSQNLKLVIRKKAGQYYVKEMRRCYFRMSHDRFLPESPSITIISTSPHDGEGKR